MPQVSVIVPIYKAENYIERCVESILNQSFRDLELVLVDDGSPDRCPEMCDVFAARDNRVRVIHQQNSGVAAARNAGLSVAKGEYFTFVDSDDYIEPDMYASMMEIARRYDCDLVMCDCIKEFIDHTELYTHDIRSGYYNRKQLENEYFQHLLIMPNVEYPPTISNWLCLCRHRHSQDNESSLRYEEGIRYSEDLLFGALMIYQAQSFYYMKNEPFYHYNCENQQSATHTFAPDKWNDFKKLYDCICVKFGNCPTFDFSEQIDKVLLFFVYNSVGEILSANGMSAAEKLNHANCILKEQAVRNMFKRLHVIELPISKKLKILTICYKYCICLSLICRYMSR